MPKLPRHPDPGWLRSLDPPIREVGDNRRWHRIYRRGGERATPWNALRHFGPTDARFDHHLGDNDGRPQQQARGIMYVASDIPTCLAEVFQNTREVDRRDRHPWLVSFRFRSKLLLLDLTDTFPVQSGASMKLMTGPRRYAQNWARGYYESYPSIDGLYFNSSMTNRAALALFERVAPKAALPEVPDLHRSLADPLLLVPLQEACADIGYGMTPDNRF